MIKNLRFFITISILFIAAFTRINAQTTYDFSTAPSLSFGDGGFGIWYTQANITIDGVNYKITSGGNGSLSHQATGGNSNSKVLRKEGSGGDVFTLQRNDGQAFKFYGFWVKHQSMNSYAQFYSLPPFYTITYNKSDGTTETYNDNTPMQGGTSPGINTTAANTFTKDLTVTSVSISFKAILYYWIDDIIVGPAVTAPSFTGNPPNRTICAGSNTTFPATAINATSYQWQANTGSGFSNISNSAPYSGATTSTLTITSATASMNGYTYRCVATGSGSTNSNTSTLTVKMVSLADAQTNIACFGGTGSATVTASGGIGPYTYSWSPSGGTGATASNLLAGTYTVTVTDNITCSAQKSFTITQPAAALSATTAQINISCFGGSNGAAGVTVSGGTGAYTYSWAPSGGTGATATGLAAGTYTVTITDANNCQITKSITVTQPTAALSATTAQTNVSCFGGSNGTASVTTSGGAGSYSYSWAPSGGTNATASGLTAGTYTVTITDVNGCQITKSFTITQPTAALSATTAQTNVSCFGGSNGTASVTTSGGTGTYSYSWAPSGGTNATASGLTAGTYTVTITDVNSCQITKTFTITQPTAALSATTSKTDVSCFGSTDGTAGVTVSGGTSSYNYSWAPSGGTGATASGLAPNTYTVTITDANSCQITKSITIGEPAAINVTATPSSAEICNGTATNVQLSSTTSGASFAWTAATISGTVNGASASSGTSIAQTLSGNGVKRYTITPSKNGCTGTTQTLDVTVKPQTTISAQPSNKNIDEEQNTTFSITAANVTGYQWQVNPGSGFTNIANGAPYSGATTATLTITGATGAMHGNIYRCVASGDCSAGVNSNGATLSVRVKATQTITMEIAGSATYGDADFAPTSSSSSGLTLTFTSSDNNIASIVNGKVHIKKAGQVTITASQTGDNDYKPAAPISQTLTIAKKDVTISFNSSPLITKVYDRSKTATLATQNYSIAGLINEDVVSATYTAEYADKNAGEGKVISVTGLTLSGNDRSNYQLTTSTGTASGTISPKDVTPSVNSSAVFTKEYDATKNITLSSAPLLLSGVLNPDEVSVSGVAQYTDKTVGTGKTINVTDLSLNGADKANYSLTTTSLQATGDITQKEIIARFSRNPVITKVYDGNTSADPSQQNYQLVGVEEGDDVSVSGTAVYEDKTAGTSKAVTVDNMALSGDDKDNYMLANTSAVTSGIITPKVLTVKLEQTQLSTNLYDLKKDPALNTINYLLTGIIGNDDVKLKDPVNATPLGKAGAPRGAFANELTLIGEDAGNYSLDITGAVEPPAKTVKKQLTVTNRLGSKLSGTQMENYSMKAWSSNHQILTVKINSAEAQKAALVIYTEAGVPVMLEQKQLNKGVNVFNFQVSSLTRGIYVVGVKGSKFNSTQKVRL